MPPRQGLLHIISALRVLPTSLPRPCRLVLVFAPFVFCNYVRGRIELKHEECLANRPVTSEEL